MLGGDRPCENHDSESHTRTWSAEEKRFGVSLPETTSRRFFDEHHRSEMEQSNGGTVIKDD